MKKVEDARSERAVPVVTFEPARDAGSEATPKGASTGGSPSVVAASKATHRIAKGATSTPGAGASKVPTAKKATRSSKARSVLKESDNRFTARTFVKAVEYSFGKISFDPCWHPASAVKPKAYFDVREGHDGLTDEWSGRLAFVNPPWSNQKKWIERAYDQWLKGNVGTVICLVPSKTDTDLFHDILAKDADIFFLKRRPRFSKVDGTSQSTAQSVMVVIFGATPAQKERFAEQVAGSWCLLVQSPSVRMDNRRAGLVEVIRHRGLVPYAFTYPGPDVKVRREATSAAACNIGKEAPPKINAVFISNCGPGSSSKVICGPSGWPNSG